MSSKDSTESTIIAIAITCHTTDGHCCYFEDISNNTSFHDLIYMNIIPKLLKDNENHANNEYCLSKCYVYDSIVDNAYIEVKPSNFHKYIISAFQCLGLIQAQGRMQIKLQLSTSSDIPVSRRISRHQARPVMKAKVNNTSTSSLSNASTSSSDSLFSVTFSGTKRSTQPICLVKSTNKRSKQSSKTNAKTSVEGVGVEEVVEVGGDDDYHIFQAIASSDVLAMDRLFTADADKGLFTRKLTHLTEVSPIPFSPPPPRPPLHLRPPPFFLSIV